jgi:hypothetical protein
MQPDFAHPPLRGVGRDVVGRRFARYFHAPIGLRPGDRPSSRSSPHPGSDQRASARPVESATAAQLPARSPSRRAALRRSPEDLSAALEPIRAEYAAGAAGWWWRRPRGPGAVGVRKKAREPASSADPGTSAVHEGDDGTSRRASSRRAASAGTRVGDAPPASASTSTRSPRRPEQLLPTGGSPGDLLELPIWSWLRFWCPPRRARQADILAPVRRRAWHAPSLLQRGLHMGAMLEAILRALGGAGFAASCSRPSA